MDTRRLAENRHGEWFLPRLALTIGEQVLTQGGVDNIAQGFASVGRLALGMAKDLVVQHKSCSHTNIHTYAGSVVKRLEFLREYRRTFSVSG